ncbi:unnamed protein product [Hymenolepis diminuta]|uniref:BACK domain-containing protein n=1 Tax=Hymenolepis diminuta TaxID=6216 RepID=A0A0R3SEG0_HYMDI|nr:unnamed protein product [Hymenolepis diminuta]
MENLKDVWSAASATGNVELINYCAPIIAGNLNVLKNSPNFLAFISGKEFKNLLKEGIFESLSEEDKLLMISLWIKAGEGDEKLEREQHFESLIDHLELGKFSSEFIIDVLTNNEGIDLPKSLIDYFVATWKEKQRSQCESSKLGIKEEVYIYGVKPQSSQEILTKLPYQDGGSSMEFNLINAPECCIIGFRSSIYFIGGSFVDGSVHSTVKKVNPQSGKLVKLASMIFNRSEHSVAANEKSIFVFGGIIDSGSSSTASCEQYDPMKDSWTMLPAMSSRRYASGATYVEDVGFLVVGGFTELEPRYRMVELLERTHQKWNWRTLFPTIGKYNKPAVASFQSRVFIAGGKNGDVEMLSFKLGFADQWTHISNVNTDYGVPYSMLSYKEKLLLTTVNGDVLELHDNTDPKVSQEQ